MSASDPVGALVENLFRHSSGRLVASLTRIFGPEHLALAEDVVQEALLKALRQWPFRGVPANPGGWLVQVARNLALDHLRRDQTFRSKEAEVRAWAELSLRALAPVEVVEESTEVRDDQLKMMFLCCHDAIPRDARVALTLKTLCGFGVAEIARAFLAQESAIAQRLVRAKRRLASDPIPFALPGPRELDARLDSVLEALYLMFNEGYAAHRGEELVRRDLMRESMRLVDLLLEHAAFRLPRVHALYALMAFQAARTAARLDHLGHLAVLADQDRSCWDQDAIQVGFAHLAAAGEGDELSEYHLQAAIASQHVLAPTFADTDWRAIRELYDLLLARNPSPVVALNRAVAIAMERGPAAGLAALDAIPDRAALSAYHLLPAIRGELLYRLGRLEAARTCFDEALRLPCSDPERDLLARKIAACGG